MGMLLFAAAAPVLADIGIETSINPSRGTVGEPLTLSIVVNGSSSVKPPRLPNFANFRSYSQGHSQEISFVNGKMSARTVFSYVLIPTTAGKHVLGQLELDIDGRPYKTGMLEVDVEDVGAANSSFSTATAPRSAYPSPVVPPAPRSLPPDYMGGKDIFVRTWVDKDDVFVNEPVYLTYTVYTRVSATFRGFDKEPVTTGFWVEEFPPQADVNRQEKEISGYRYVVADVRTVALFPTEAGVHTLDPGVLKADIEIREQDDFDSFFSTDIFGRRRFRPSSVVTRVVPKLLATDPIVITARPLPDTGKPADFRGAVGRYTIEASVDRTEVEEGEPITVKLRLAGEGDLNTAELPKLPEMDYFKSYDSSSSTNTRKERLVVEGEKIQETVLVPKKSGVFTIPSVSFSYFDPRKKQYQTAKTAPLIVSIKAGREEPATAPIAVGPQVPPQDVPLIGEDIRFVKTVSDPLVHEEEPLLSRRSYWVANAALPAAALLIFLIRLLVQLIRRDVSGLRVRRSHRVARSRLAAARKNLKKGAETAFYEALSKALYGYFADKFDWGPGEADMNLVEKRLIGRLSDDEFARLRDIAHRIHLGRFARSEGTLDEMKGLYASSDQLITTLESKKL